MLLLLVLGMLQVLEVLVVLKDRAPERWERVPSQFEILEATFG